MLSRDLDHAPARRSGLVAHRGPAASRNRPRPDHPPVSGARIQQISAGTALPGRRSRRNRRAGCAGSSKRRRKSTASSGNSPSVPMFVMDIGDHFSSGHVRRDRRPFLFVERGRGGVRPPSPSRGPFQRGPVFLSERRAGRGRPCGSSRPFSKTPASGKAGRTSSTTCWFCGGTASTFRASISTPWSRRT